MKRLLSFAAVLAIASIPAFAATHSQSVDVPDTVTVAGTQLPAGHYKVTWTGSGSSVQVTLKQQDVKPAATATVQAKLVEQNNNRAAVTIDNRSGVKVIQLIQLNHVNLLLSSEPAPGQ